MESINQTLSVLTDRTNLAQMQINGLQDDLVNIKSENTSTSLPDNGTPGQVLTLDNSSPPQAIWDQPSTGSSLSTTETDKQYLSSDLQLDFGHYIYTTYVSANGVGYGHNYLYLQGGFAHLGGGHWDGAMMASSSAYARVRNSDSRRFYGSHSYQVASDDRLKHNEVDLSDCLQTIRKLKPQKYQKTNVMKEADFNGELQDGEWVEEAGLIAQDILQIPELSWCVGGGGTEAETPNDTPKEQPYSVAYHNVEMYHLQATKELDQQVQQMKESLNELATQVQQLTARIQALETPQ